jgi:hypothetical protein
MLNNVEREWQCGVERCGAADSVPGFNFASLSEAV